MLVNVNFEFKKNYIIPPLKLCFLADRDRERERYRDRDRRDRDRERRDRDRSRSRSNSREREERRSDRVNEKDTQKMQQAIKARYLGGK